MAFGSFARKSSKALSMASASCILAVTFEVTIARRITTASAAKIRSQ